MPQLLTGVVIKNPGKGNDTDAVHDIDQFNTGKNQHTAIQKKLSKMRKWHSTR